MLRLPPRASGALFHRRHSLLSPGSSDDEEADPEDDELASDSLESDPEPPTPQFRVFRAFRLAARNRNRAARRGVTANGSAAAAAETAASGRLFFLRERRLENVAAVHPHEETFFPREGNHASVWHVAQKARPVCFFGAASGQRARAARNARRQHRFSDRRAREAEAESASFFASFSSSPASAAAAAHRFSPKAASATARHGLADSARVRHSRETHAARASACGCRRSST